MSNEDDLFGKAMKDVRRIESQSRRVAIKKSSAAGLPQRVRPAVPVLPDSPAYRPDSSSEPWVLKADGVSAERMRQLAAGRPGVDGEIDLHGMTREEMYRDMSRVLDEALDKGWRVLSLVHGRGLHSESGKPVLKEAVYGWLRDGPYAGWVLAVMPRPGTGGGSALVLLRRRR